MSSVFISYSRKDKTFVRKLAYDLCEAGHTIWFDEGEIRIGDSLVNKISDAIGSVDFVIAIISSTSINSQWVKKELDLASNREIDENGGIILPIRLDNVELPGFLKGKCYADYRNEADYHQVLSALLSRLGPRTPPPDITSEELVIRPYLRITTLCHSWLRVPLSELEQLGINEKISGYSYKDNLYAYLEEDDDEMMFREAKEKEYGANYNPEEDTFTVFISELLFEERTKEKP